MRSLHVRNLRLKSIAGHTRFMRKLLFTSVMIVVVLVAVELGARVMLWLAGVDPATLIPSFVSTAVQDNLASS